MSVSAKRFALAGFSSSVVMFSLGAVGHGFLLKNVREGVLRDAPLLPAIYGGILILAFLMAYAYPAGYKGGSPVAEGLRFGIFIALLWTIPGGLVRFGAQRGISMTPILFDAAWHVVEEGCGGIVIGLVYGRPAKDKTLPKRE